MADMFGVTDHEKDNTKGGKHVVLDGRDGKLIRVFVKSSHDLEDTISFSFPYRPDLMDKGNEEMFMDRLNQFFEENFDLQKDVDALIDDQEFDEEYYKRYDRVTMMFQDMFTDVENEFDLAAKKQKGDVFDRDILDNKDVLNDIREDDDGVKYFGANGLVALHAVDGNTLSIELKSDSSQTEGFKFTYDCNESLVSNIGVDRFMTEFAKRYDENDNSLMSLVDGFYEDNLSPLVRESVAQESLEEDSLALADTFNRYLNSMNSVLLPEIEKLEEERHKLNQIHEILGKGIELDDDERKLVNSRVYLQPVPLGASPDFKIPTHGFVDFEKFEDGQLSFSLNYMEDGTFYKGVPVTLAGMHSKKDADSIMLRVDSLMADNGFLMGEFINQYVKTGREDGDRHLHEISNDLLGAALFTVVSKYEDEKDRRSGYVVAPEPVDNLITMHLDGSRDENGNILPDSKLTSVKFSFNYTGTDGKLYKGIDVDASHCFDLTKDAQAAYDDVTAFYQRLHTEYTKVDVNGHLDRIKSWCVGWDRAGIEKDEFTRFPRGNLAYFDEQMDLQHQNLVGQFDKFVKRVQQTVELERNDDKLTKFYGKADNLLDVVSLDNESFTVRLNHKCNPLNVEEPSIRQGVEYTFSWYGADSVTNEQKAKFLTLLEEELSQNQTLQDEIWQYNLRRCFKNDDRKSVNVGVENDEDSKILSSFLRDFERNLKYNLPSIRRRQAAQHDEDIQKLSALSQQVSQAMADEVQFLRAKGPFGRLKMRLFHQSEYQKHKQHIAELQQQDAELKEKEQNLVDEKGFSPRTRAMLEVVNTSLAHMKPDEWKIKLDEAMAQEIDILHTKENVVEKTEHISQMFSFSDSEKGKTVDSKDKSAKAETDFTYDFSDLFTDKARDEKGKSKFHDNSGKKRRGASR